MASPESRKRGRPPVFSDETLRQAAGYSYARRVRTRRGSQDLVYRMFAIATIELYCEAYPEKATTLEWLLIPKRRHALLSELGRIGRPKSDERGELSWDQRNVSRLMQTALELAEVKPSTKAGITMIRERRRDPSGARAETATVQIVERPEAPRGRRSSAPTTWSRGHGQSSIAASRLKQGIVLDRTGAMRDDREPEAS